MKGKIECYTAFLGAAVTVTCSTIAVFAIIFFGAYFLFKSSGMNWPIFCIILGLLFAIPTLLIQVFSLDSMSFKYDSSLNSAKKLKKMYVILDKTSKEILGKKKIEFTDELYGDLHKFTDEEQDKLFKIFEEITTIDPKFYRINVSSGINKINMFYEKNTKAIIELDSVYFDEKGIENTIIEVEIRRLCREYKFEDFASLSKMIKKYVMKEA